MARRRFMLYPVGPLPPAPHEIVLGSAGESSLLPTIEIDDETAQVYIAGQPVSSPNQTPPAPQPAVLLNPSEDQTVAGAYKFALADPGSELDCAGKATVGGDAALGGALDVAGKTTLGEAQVDSLNVGTEAVLPCPPTAPDAGSLENSQITFYVDETKSVLGVIVKMSDGSTKGGVVPLLQVVPGSVRGELRAALTT